MARLEYSSSSQIFTPSSRSSDTTVRSTGKTQQSSEGKFQRELVAPEGVYQISAIIDNINKSNTNSCLSEPVKVNCLTRLRALTNPQRHDHIPHNEILAFNLGKDLILYEFTESDQVS
jgi:hypothetical protein